MGGRKGGRGGRAEEREGGSEGGREGGSKGGREGGSKGRVGREEQRDGVKKR